MCFKRLAGENGISQLAMARFVISGNADYAIRPCWVYLYSEDNYIQTCDIPDASLKGRQRNDPTVPELKRWLSCRGGTVHGAKADLVKQSARYNAAICYVAT